MSEPEVLRLTREWAAKADDDFGAAEALIASGGAAWIVCFHAQQAVEKYLKTLLVSLQLPFGKVHDIDELLRALPEVDRPVLQPDAAFELTRYAVAGRYPEAPEPSRADAIRAIECASQVRAFVQGRLRLF